MVRFLVRIVACLGCFALAACDEKPGEVSRVTLALRLSGDPGCQAADTSLFRVSALGDFATTDRTVGILDVSRGALTFSSFPLDTQALRIESDFSFGGTRFLSALYDTNEVLLLPLSRTCRLSDEALPGLQGAAVVALPDGGMLAVGGVVGDSAQRSVLRLRAGAARPELLEVSDALFAKRANASATLVDGFVVVIGGETRVGGSPEDSIEIYNLATERFDRDAVPTSFLAEARTQHAALRLFDGRILVAGGMSTSGLLATSEIVDIHSGEVEVDLGRLPNGRRSMVLTTLDDGTILALGGETQTATVTRPLGDILVFDLATRVYAPLHDGLSFDARSFSLILPLPGNRVAYIGGESSPDHFVDAVDVLHVNGEPHIERPALLNASCGTGAFCRPLRNLAAAVLVDGRVLVSGTDRDNGSARAYLLDFNRDTSTEIGMSNLATHALTLIDGTTLLLTPDGVFARRESLATRYDNPSTLIAGTMEGIALDARSHWQVGTNTLTALDEARLDIPFLRYADVDIELEVAGTADLLLIGEVSTDAISIRADEVGFALCHAPRVSGSRVRIERRANTLTFNGGAESVSCASSGGLGTHLGIAIEARVGTELGALRLTRVAR